MPEESHLDEMRAALKGDRERAAKRPATVPVLAPVTPERTGVLERLRRFLFRR